MSLTVSLPDTSSTPRCGTLAILHAELVASVEEAERETDVDEKLQRRAINAALLRDVRLRAVEGTRACNSEDIVKADPMRGYKVSQEEVKGTYNSALRFLHFGTRRWKNAEICAQGRCNM